MISQITTRYFSHLSSDTTEMTAKQLKQLLVTNFVLALLLVPLLAMALILGEEQERIAWSQAPSTLPFYTTDEICQDDSGSVLNCGHCGSCSNLQDIEIYHHTRENLTNIMTDCGKGDLLFARDAFDCLKRNVGLTDDCAKCWVTNYECTVKSCVHTCIKHRVFSIPSKSELLELRTAGSVHRL